MGFVKGMTGNPDGRPKGTPNKINQQLRETIGNFLLNNFSMVIEDFEDYSKHLDLFKNIDTAFFCIGSYTGQVPDEKFKIITVRDSFITQSNIKNSTFFKYLF